MLLNPSKPSTNILVTILMVAMVVIFPAIDTKICRRLGVSLSDRLSSNPDADRLLHLRKYLLIFIFLFYLMGVGYVTFFSRNAAKDYLLHISFMEGFISSFNIDLGILGFINMIFQKGLPEAVSHVRVTNFENIYQVYLNVCMFVPMGFLLPYVFDWYRKYGRRKVLVTSFLTSLAIENIQLVSRMGYYDIDDLFTNTLGGMIGYLLFIGFAYIITNPNWRQDLKQYNQWRLHFKDRALTPFSRKVHVSRTTLFACDKDAVKDFYGDKLGFYLRKTLIGDDNKLMGYLFEFGKTQLEIRCSDSYHNLPDQQLTIACNNSEYLKKRLEKHQIEVSSYEEDPYTGLRTFHFNGPDRTVVTIIEE
ncbi:MAG: VanZ family protein [Erysipelotrichaceae bacterium]|nr:VanZ family protein [Erysipelotrichaceae bacterium]